MSRRADALWRRLVAAVMETMDDYRGAVSAATGLPFGRARVLRRLAGGPLTLRGLAEASGTDAPATTVTVNVLESRGLVVRVPHPTNRRAKLVSLTAEGRAVVARMAAVSEPAPPAFVTAPASEHEALARLLDRLEPRRS